MKHLITFLVFMQFNIAFAQNLAQPTPDAIISLSMISVCMVDRDSKQCEMLQVVFNRQRDVDSGEQSEIEPEITSETRKALIEMKAERKNLMETMEFENKIKLSRMYRALDQAVENICKVKPNSNSCDHLLAAFINQTKIELGESLNPPAEIPTNVKKDLREFILKKQPNLNESSQIIIEAMMLWKLRGSNN